jgi:arsenate reductase-like glutaredoxin family protein
MGPRNTILFTQSGCRDSRRVRSWLNARQVAFTERNVTGDPDAAKVLLATGYFATPLLVSGESVVIGFRPTSIAAALNLKEPPE